MKLKRGLKIICYLIIIIMLGGILTGADTENFKVITERQPLGKVQYEGYDITASKISIEGSDNVVYCLEINKKYPSGQNFSLGESLYKNIDNIIAAGYPNRSYKELKLSNDNEAYFATQIAIWSAMEGYDVNKFKGDNPYILEAIRNIYNDGINGKYTNKIRTKAYKTNDTSVQNIVVVHLDDLVAEQKAESIQKEYPPQEG